MSILGAIAATATKIAEGAMMAAAVYVANRCAKHAIKKSKK